MEIIFINLTYDIKGESNHKLFHPRHPLPPLDIGYCASLLEKVGYRTTFIDTALGGVSYSELIDRAIKIRSKSVVVIRPNEMAYDLSIKLARDIRKKKGRSVSIFLIGPVASASLNYFMFKDTPFDLCIIGEPEYVLLEAIEKSNSDLPLDSIKGTARFIDGSLRVEQEREYIGDLDELPFPKHDFFIGKGYALYYPVKMTKKKNLGCILSSRGCPHPCLFCSPVSRVSYGNTYRARSVENMMNEVEFLSGLGVNLIYFLDDLFTCDKGRVERFCSRMQKSNLKMKWVAQCRIDNLTKDLLKLMKNSGCACLNIGVESGSERILKKLRKDLDLGKVEAMARYCRSVGINTVGNFILGSPGEEDADRIKSIKFARKANFDIIEVLFFTPYPGSYAFREYGRLDKVDQYCRYEKVTQNQETIDRERIERFRNFFYKKFYLRAGFLSRNIPMYIYSAVLNGRNEWRLLRKAMRYIIF